MGTQTGILLGDKLGIPIGGLPWSTHWGPHLGDSLWGSACGENMANALVDTTGGKHWRYIWETFLSGKILMDKNWGQHPEKHLRLQTFGHQFWKQNQGTILGTKIGGTTWGSNRGKPWRTQQGNTLGGTHLRNTFGKNTWQNPIRGTHLWDPNQTTRVVDIHGKQRGRKACWILLEDTIWGQT
jgi:hypothetical protein